MTKRIAVHPTTPQKRAITQAVAALRAGGLIAYPTDACYSLGCCIADKAALDRLRRLRALSREHLLTLVCRDLSELSSYARVGTSAFRTIKSYIPGPYTFLLQASREVPRRLQDPKRKTVGLRVPAHPVTAALLESLGEPLMSSTLQLPEALTPLSEPDDIMEQVGSRIDLLLDAGACGLEPSTVIDLTGDNPVLVRAGAGPVSDQSFAS